MVMWDPAKIRREKDKQEEQDYNNRFNLLARIQDQRKKNEQRKQNEQAVEKSKKEADIIGKTPTENLTVGK
jgi:hypothetical protein